MNTYCLVAYVCCLVYTYIYKTTNTFSCIRRWRIFEMDFATWQDNDAHQIANSQKPFRKYFIRARKLLALLYSISYV